MKIEITPKRVAIATLTLSALGIFTFINSWTFQSWNTIRMTQNTYADAVEDLKTAERDEKLAKNRKNDARSKMYISHLCADRIRMGERVDCSSLTYKTADGGYEPLIDYTQTIYNWRLNSEGMSQTFLNLSGNTYFERAKNLFEIMGRDSGEVNAYYEAGYRTGIKPEMLICIAKADSNLGNSLSTKNNPGNVGNNDRGNRVAYNSLEEGIEAIGNVLNNKYLGDKKTIGELSPGGGGVAPYYATSKENWNVNVINCLSMIYDKAIYEDFKFRLLNN